MKKLLLSLLTVAASVCSHADSYTIEFNFTGGTEAGTAISETADFAAGLTQASKTYASGASTLTQVWKSTPNDLKLGSNKNPGKVVITLTDAGKVVPTSVEVYAKRCNTTGAPGISVNGATLQTVSHASSTDGYTAYKFDITDGKALENLTLDTGTTAVSTTAKKGAIYVDKIVVNYGNEGGGETPEPETVAVPTFEPGSGALTDGQTVSISCETEGAAIHYTINGGADTEYRAPISFTESGEYTVVAYAMKGEAKSADVTATYTYTAATVNPDPEVTLGDIIASANGTVIKANDVITLEEGAQIEIAVENAEMIDIAVSGGLAQIYYTTPAIFTPAICTQRTTTITAKRGDETKTLVFTLTVTEKGATVDPEPTPVKGAWNKVTLDSQLEVGAKYILVNKANSRAMGNAAKSNNRPSVEVTISDADKAIATIGDDVAIIELEYVEGNIYRWKVTNALGTSGSEISGAYLYGKASDNGLQQGISFMNTSGSTQKNLSYCSVSIENGNAVIIFQNCAKNRNVTKIFYNGSKNVDAPTGYNQLFNAYSYKSTVTTAKDGQYQPVELYKFVADDSSSISEVEGAEGAEVEWYDLSGRRVAEPVKGIYIRRQGNKAVKMAF